MSTTGVYTFCVGVVYVSTRCRCPMSQTPGSRFESRRHPPPPTTTHKQITVRHAIDRHPWREHFTNSTTKARSSTNRCCTRESKDVTNSWESPMFNIVARRQIQIAFVVLLRCFTQEFASYCAVTAPRSQIKSSCFPLDRTLKIRPPVGFQRCPRRHL